MALTQLPGTMLSTVNSLTSASGQPLVLQTNNGTTALTINTSQQATFTNNVSMPNTFGFKNRIINGDFRVSQYNSNNSVTLSGGAYFIDRWYEDPSGAFGWITYQQASSTPPPGFANYLSMTSVGANSPSSGVFLGLEQRIESQNLQDLAWGTSNAKTCTLSFWIQSSLTGTFGGVIWNSARNYSYVFSYSIASANTWQYVTVTIPGPTSGTWLLSGNGIGLWVTFALAAGSNYQTTASSWASGWYFGPTGMTNLTATSGATMFLTGVQFEPGTQATSFDYRDIGREFFLCQRYFQRSYDLGVATGTVVAGPVSGTWQYNQPSYFIGTGNYAMNCGTPFPVTMRAIPTITVYSPSSGTAGSITPWNGSDYTLISNGGFINASTSRITGGSYNANTTANLTYGFQWTASAEL